MNTNDRFTKISDDYALIWNEIYASQGLSYEEFQQSIFDQVSKIANFKNLPILDLGCGDGETSAKFIEAGCKSIVGVDLNQTMLDQCAARFGNKMTLVRGDVTDLSQFAPGQFPVIITGATIHNLPRALRPKFWVEIIRLRPEIFVIGDKIADPDPVKHAEYLANEVAAVKKAYIEKRGLIEAGKEWVEHYATDERERLEFAEIQEGLGEFYNISIVLEMGMIKTISCQLK
ncbi:MAG: class I SAM-dependent methyltransferase [Candidatus Berkelbacteria bacterium]